MCDGIHLIGRLCRIVTGHKVIHGSTKIVDIGTTVGLTLSSELLRSSIALSTETCSILYIAFLIFSGNTKIYQRNITVGFQHDISRFHITIYDWWILMVKIIQYITELLGPFNSIGL